MAKNPLVVLSGVRKVYRNGELNNEVLSGVDLDIGKGEFVAVVGSSGSGKTTLLNLIGALDRPTQGKVCVDGEVVSRMSDKQCAAFRKKNIGFIFQDYNLIQVLNVFENILLPLQLCGAKIDEAKVDQMLKALNISEKKYCYPSQLSGGEQQRVSIIRALVHSPSLVLADEPTGNLDANNSSEVIALLKRLCKDYNQTTIVVTHNMEIAKQCDRMIVIQNGVAQGGSSEETIAKTV